MLNQSKPQLQLRSSRNKHGGAWRLLVLFLVAVVAFLVYEIISFHQSENTLLASKSRNPGKVEFSSDNQKQMTVSTDDRRSSTLYKDWLLNVFQAAGRLPTNEQVVSFRMFDLRRSLRHVKGPPPFFYPVEETLHSALYIVENEIPVLMSWMKDLQRAQAEKTTANCLDVGSNGGFFSLMSRSAGCRTLAVDAQPWCLQRLSSAATLNGFTTDLDVRWTAVGDDPSQSINVGATKCSGLWAVKDSEWINQESSESINVSMTPLLDIVNEWIDSTETIDLFKIDVEGSEMAVLHSAVPLFAANRIGSVYAEIAPGRAIKITPLDIILETIKGIYKAGYDIRYASSQKKLDLAEAKAHFADERARYRNDPNMFAISKVAAAGSNP